jgi:hypothetical protein
MDVAEMGGRLHFSLAFCDVIVYKKINFFGFILFIDIRNFSFRIFQQITLLH